MCPWHDKRSLRAPQTKRASTQAGVEARGCALQALSPLLSACTVPPPPVILNSSLPPLNDPNQAGVEARNRALHAALDDLMAYLRSRECPQGRVRGAAGCGGTCACKRGVAGVAGWFWVAAGNAHRYMAVRGAARPRGLPQVA